MKARIFTVNAENTNAFFAKSLEIINDKAMFKARIEIPTPDGIIRRKAGAS